MKKYKIIRMVLLILIVIGGFLIQNNAASWIPFLSVSPNILLIITFSIGFLRGKMVGMFCGLLCGLLLDSFSGGVLGYYTLAFIYIGYLNGMLARILVNDMILLPLGLCLVSEICYSIYVYVFGALLTGKSNFLDYVTTIALPELIVTIFCTVILYGLILFADRALSEREKKETARSYA